MQPCFGTVKHLVAPNYNVHDGIQIYRNLQYFNVVRRSVRQWRTSHWIARNQDEWLVSIYSNQNVVYPLSRSWVSYQIRKIVYCACAGNAGNIFPATDFKWKSLISDPGMHHGTCVTHVPWCMSGLLTCGGGGKRSRHSRRMRNSQLYVSGKRPFA